MKPTNGIVRIAVIAVLAIGLGACGKKKNGSSTPAAPPSTSTSTETCTWNSTTQQYVISGTSTACQTCPASGKYTDQNGVQQTCTVGQPLGNNWWNPPNNNYPGNNGFPNGGCSYYEQMYQTYYVPIYMTQYQQYMCVRYDLVYGYGGYNNPYQNYGYNYYYAYPPYTGSQCGTQINFGGSWGSVGVCF